jgi:hypothetical protein
MAAAVALPAALAAAQTDDRPALTAQIADPVAAQADYVENCGGCHGVHGLSAPALVPQLRDRVGYFLCTPEARAYLIRLPNVAHSRIKDNQQLADLVNFVLFGLGGASTPADTRPFTADEVAYERQFALSSASLKDERARLVESAIRKCRAPASLRALYPTAPPL